MQLSYTVIFFIQTIAALKKGVFPVFWVEWWLVLVDVVV